MRSDTQSNNEVLNEIIWHAIVETAVFFAVTNFNDGHSNLADGVSFDNQHGR